MPEIYSIHRYTKADREGVFELVSAAYSRDFAARLIRQWDWKYDSHPANREAEESRRNNRVVMESLVRDRYTAKQLVEWDILTHDLEDIPPDGPYVLLLKDRDKVIAMEGALPQAFLVNGIRQMVSIGCDLAVHPDYRGRKLSMRLILRIAYDHGFTFAWANPASRGVGLRWIKKFARRSRPPTQYSKWGRMRLVPLVKPLDWADLTHRATGVRLLGRAAAIAVAGARRMRGNDHPRPIAGVEVFKMEAFDDRIDALWNRCAPEHQVIGVRDRRRLNWRFDSRPDADYVRVVAARGRNLIGYLVFRIAEQEGALWGHIVDFLVEGNDTAVFELMLSDAEERMNDDGVKGMVCIAAIGPFRAALRRSGFFPALLRIPTFLGGSATTLNEELKAYGDVKKWFATAADGDLEMAF